MRAILMLTMLAACNGDPSPSAYVEVRCSGSWPDFAAGASCDSACKAPPTTLGPPSCDTRVTTGNPSGPVFFPCTETFDFEGVRGCCVDTHRSTTITADGEPTRTRRIFWLECK